MKQHLTRSLVALVALLLFLGVGVLVANSADNGYRGQYYNNRNLQGQPVLTRNDSMIDFNWGLSSPAPGIVNDDDFSVRWTRTVNLQAGTYRFTASTDDGVRVRVNNRLIINQWWDHELRTFSADVYVPAGNTPIVVEYYEHAGRAIASFKYELLNQNVQTATPKPWNPTATPKPWNPTATPKPWNPTATPKPWNPTATPKPWNPTATPKPWNPTATPVPAGSGPELAACTNQPLYATYWNNRFLSGPPALTRTEGTINYNWGNGSPAGNIQNDNFSARWSTTYNLLAGTYNFSALADDGIRVYVNGERIIDRWTNSAAQTTQVNYYHAGGRIDVVVEYYEAAQFATVAFSCTRTSGNTQAPAPTATNVPPTAVPPTATPDPLLTANAGTCQISRVYHLNVRSGPGLSFAIVGTVKYGEIVIRTGGSNGSWVQIRTDDQKIGWIKAYYCGNGELPETTQQTAPTCGTIMATVDALYVRSGPGSSYSWLDVSYRGEALTLTCKCEGQWISVLTAEGVRGWVYYPYTNITQAQLNTLH